MVVAITTKVMVMVVLMTTKVMVMVMMVLMMITIPSTLLALSSPLEKLRETPC